MASTPIIELQNVSKLYRVGDQEIRALDDVSLKIHEGEYLSIVGPSGSGKSTLMHILGCLDSPSSGTMFLEGQDVSRLGDGRLAKVRNQKIGFVFQSFNLLSRLNVLDNIGLPLIYAGISTRKRHAMAREAAEKVGLGDRLHNRPGQLSGGQSQRVAIARAMVNKPRIIFADEPTGALDTQTGETILNLFRELVKQGNTIALVTHAPEIAQETPRRVTLRDGKIEHQVEDAETSLAIDNFQHDSQFHQKQQVPPKSA
jgi:putative ABC transport system ATP-binding protein